MNGHALAGADQHAVAGLGQPHPGQGIAVFEGDGDQAVGADVGKGRQACAFDVSAAGEHHQHRVFGEFTHRQQRGDLFLTGDGQQLHDRCALGAAAAQRHPIGGHGVDDATIRKQQQGVVVIAADEQLDGLFALAAGAGLAAGAATGGLEFVHRHALEVAVLGEHHHRALIGDQVDVFETTLDVEDLGAAGGVEAAADRSQLVDDQRQNPLTATENVFVVGNLGDEILMLEADLVGFQGGEPPQLHLQDGIGLDLAEAMAILQLLAGGGRVGGGPDQGDDRIELIKGQQQAEQDVVALFSLAQKVPRASLDRLDPKIEKHLQHLAQGEQHRLPLDQRQHVGAEVVLQRGELEQVVEHNLGIGVAAQFDDDAHAVAVRFVANVSDAFELLVVDQLGDAFDQGGLVGLVGQLGDHHRIAIGAPLGLDCFDGGHATHGHRATAGAVGLADAAAAEDLAAGGKVGPGNERHQLPIAQLRVLDQGQQTVDQLAQVVGWDVGRHAHGDARGAVEQQLGDARRHHGGLLLGAVKVVDEVDGFGLDVVEQAVGGQSLQARLGVAHRGWRVVVDRAEVAMPIDQGHAHGEVLGHAHQGVVDRRVAVGVVFAQHFAHHTGAFAVGAIAGESQLVHRIKDAAMHRFEAVAGIGQRPAHDHAHRILQIGARHLIAQICLDDPGVGIVAGFAWILRSGWIRHALPI